MNGHLHSRWWNCLALLPGLGICGPYAYDPSAMHEQDGNSIRYFGSAKDARGSLLPDVTIIIRDDQSSYVFTTDASGRFRGSLPLSTPPEKVTVTCSRNDLQLVRVNSRRGPAGVKPTVQVDCVLRSKTSV